MTLFRTLLGLVGVLLVVGLAAAQPSVTVSGPILSIGGIAADGDAVLKVAGPDGYRLELEISSDEAGFVDLLGVLQEIENAPASLPVGTYYYELLSRPAGDTVSGRFSIGSSQAVVVDDAIGEVSASSTEGVEINAAESDFIAIQDIVNDGVTTLDFDSDGATSNLHWTIVNSEGTLYFQDHSVNSNNSGGALGTNNVAFMRDNIGGGIGIGTDLTIFTLDVQSTIPEINLRDTDGGSNWKLVNDTGDFKLVTDDPTTATPGALWDVVVVEDDSQEHSLYIDPSGVSLSSSRKVKKNIEPVVAGDLLDELANLPIYSWSYATDSTDSRHVGPMSEDFHQRFGLGRDDKRISSIDTGGLALAAIQALREEVVEKSLKLEQLERRLEELRAVERRLQDLEQMLTDAL